MLQRIAASALGLVLSTAGVLGLAVPAGAQEDGHGAPGHGTGHEVRHDECTAGNICFWSEPGFHGEKTVYKSALVECTRIVKPSADAPERLMTARSVKNHTERTVIIGYNDPLCLVPSSITPSRPPLRLSALSDSADLGEGIRYIRST